MSALTGPQYPPPPSAGSNAIPGFDIGVSPIGDIPAFDWWNTILSQYANSPIITALADAMFSALDQTGNLERWFDLVLNVATAQGWGLDVWGRIVGVNRLLNVTAGSFFGFKEALPTSQTFGQAAFFAGIADSTVYPLPDQTYRNVIMAKAAFNITDGSIGAINRILMNLFPGRGNAYVTDAPPPPRWFGFAEAAPTSETFGEGVFFSGQSAAGMTMTYTFRFSLSPVELSIVQQSGVLPKPVGVAATVQVIPL